MPVARIESLDHEGRGVTHADGKVIFVDGALPGEIVDFSPYQRKPSYELAQISRIVRTSPQRVTPGCRHFGKCGGCSMQHLDLAAQASVKQRVLEDALWHVGRVKPETVFAPLVGPGWNRGVPGWRNRRKTDRKRMKHPCHTPVAKVADALWSLCLRKIASCAAVSPSQPRPREKRRLVVRRYPVCPPPASTI